MTPTYDVLPGGWENYPRYNKEIGGWICSGCGVVTPVNYDDKGTGVVAPLCKKCREDWDRSCKPELKIIKDKPEDKWTLYEHTLYRWLNFLKMVKDYRHSLGLETIIDDNCQDIADRFLKEKKYLGEDDGVVWLNGEWENERWQNKEISVYFLNYDNQRRYTDFTDIFRREETLEALKSKNIRIGVAQDKDCLILILAQTVTLHSPYQTP